MCRLAAPDWPAAQEKPPDWLFGSCPALASCRSCHKLIFHGASELHSSFYSENPRFWTAGYTLLQRLSVREDGSLHDDKTAQILGCKNASCVVCWVSLQTDFIVVSEQMYAFNWHLFFKWTFVKCQYTNISSSLVCFFVVWRHFWFEKRASEWELLAFYLTINSDGDFSDCQRIIYLIVWVCAGQTAAWFCVC